MKRFSNYTCLVEERRGSVELNCAVDNEINN